MPARRVTTVTMPVDGRSGVAFEAYSERTPLLTIWAARPGLPWTFDVPGDGTAGLVSLDRPMPLPAVAAAAGSSCRANRAMVALTSSLGGVTLPSPPTVARATAPKRSSVIANTAPP